MLHNLEYEKLLLRKKRIEQAESSIKAEIHPSLFPFQKDCVEYLLKIGRGAAFLDTGLGKTILQCEWARNIPGDVLIVAPLAVANQTVREAQNHLGMEIQYMKYMEL